MNTNQKTTKISCSSRQQHRLTKRNKNGPFKFVNNCGASAEFLRSVKKISKQFPKKIIDLLKKNRYRIIVAKTVSSQLATSTKLIHKAPRGWPDGNTWDNLDGIQDQHRIIIAELFKQDRRWLKNQRMPGVLRHEIGHAIDEIFACHPHWYSSSDSEFKTVYEKDMAAITQKDKSRLAYWLQEGEAGPTETFADSFAFILGGLPNESENELFHRSFPEVQKFVQRKIEEL